MKALICGLPIATVIFVVLLFTPQRAYAQENHVFFSSNGDTTLLYYEYFNPDTKLWIAKFKVYSGIGEVNTIIDEEYSLIKVSPIHDRLEAIQNQYGVTNEGVSIERNAIPNISIQLECKKKKKIGLPEGLYTRRYISTYTVKLGDITIMADDVVCYLIGKQNRVEEIIETDILDIACWKHPKSPRYFSTYTSKTQKLIIPMYRYSYVEKNVFDHVVYVF